MSAQHHSEIKVDHERPSKYKAHLGKLNFPGIEFPVSLQDIDKFEKNNPEIKNSTCLDMRKAYTYLG